MKRDIFYFILLMVLIIGISSCDKSTTDPGYTQDSIGMHAMIKGDVFDATTTFGRHFLDTPKSHDTLRIVGLRPIGKETQAIVLEIYKYIGSGNYGIIKGYTNAKAYMALKGDTFRATTGTINLVKLDSFRVQGTFEFKSDSLKADTLKVLNGTFNTVCTYPF
jgi:hypothetical protein